MRILCAVVLLVACKQSKPERAEESVRADGCLALPAMARKSLHAYDGMLYWIESAITRDFDGVVQPYERLVRYDPATHEHVVLRDNVVGPLYFTREGIAAVIEVGSNTTLVLLRGGHVQTLVPSWFTIKDVEPVNPSTLAVLATADGKSSVFLLDLTNPRPAHVVDADVLFSATRDKLYIRDAQGGAAVDIATGAREARDIPADALPDGDDMYFVVGDQVHLRSLRTNASRIVVDERRDWTLLYQDNSVLARHAPALEPATTYLLDGGAATQLPMLPASMSFVGTAHQRGQWWALVGHNTSNIDGDLWTTAHEADVCKVDIKKPELAYEARTVPARYQAKFAALETALARIAPYRSVQLLESGNDPITLAVDYESDGGADLDKLRTQVREVYEQATSLLGDREIQTWLTFRDGRGALHRWRRDRLRVRALAGIGDILLSDPADHDLEMAEHGVEYDTKGKLRCKGKLTNLRSTALRDLQIRCVGGDRERVIPVATLEPKQMFAFDKTFEPGLDEYRFVEVYQGREQLLVRDLDAEKKLEALYAFAVALHAETGFAISNRDMNGKFHILVEARRTVKPHEVADLYDRIDKARELFGGGEWELQLQVYMNKVTYDWDGEALVPVKQR